MKESDKKLAKWYLKSIGKGIGYCIGLGATGIMSIVFYSFLKHGGIVLYETNPVISTIEFVSSLAGLGFMGYSLIKLLTENPLKELT